MQRRKLKLIIISAASLLVELVVPEFIGVAHATPPPQFTQAYVRLDRHKALSETGGTICATPSLADAAVFVDVTFPTQGTGTDFVVSSTAAHWTVTTTNLPAGATAWPGIGTATTVTGKTVRFPSTSLTGATFYCFNFASGTGASDRTLKNGSAGYVGITGSLTTYASGGVTINEQTNWATSIIADDQVVVSAVVPPSFNFSISGNTDAFTTNLDPLAIVGTTGVTFSIVTNAKSGWIAWVKDSEQGLYSATANYKINTAGTVDGAPTTLVASGASEGYGLAASIITDAAGGCTVGTDAEYTPGGSSDAGTLSANFQPVASCTGVPPATSNGDTVKIVERASIAGGTPAGSDYTDVITVVGAGNF
jgi:hypothetical protein